MNKIHRIVWNKARQCLVVVGENAKTSVKSSGTGMSDAESVFVHWSRKIAAVLMLLPMACPPFAMAQTLIKPDGRTQTTVVNTGPVYNVSTATVSGKNAFNSFSAFSVGAGNTANLYIPSSAINLINIVRDQRTDISGILNAIKDGRIGGNVWFANPHGFIVGASGVVNVGSLTVTTPTQKFVNDFFTAPGSPDQASVTQLLSGTAPRNSAGLISILGRINAAEGIELSAGAVNVAGSIYSGARFVGTAPDFTDVVNANGLASATNVIVREGRVHIVADNDVTVSGTIAAPGGVGVRGGDISIRAGGNVELNDGATVSARGNGENSAGGTIGSWAGNNAVLRSGAQMDASAGSTGDGGLVELSAKNRVTLEGGQMVADAAHGAAGTVLIDPTVLTGSGFDLFSATNYVLTATDSITLNDVVIATRDVNSTDRNRTNIDSANSIGNSGNITLTAPNITLGAGTKLLAHADGAFSGGDVTLTATKSDHMAGFRAVEANTKIELNGATLKGREISLRATSDAGYDWEGNPLEVATRAVSDAVDGSLFFGLTGFNIGVAISSGKSEVLVNSGSTIEATGGVVLAADTSSKAEHMKVGLDFLTQRFSLTGSVINAGFVWGESNATATVNVASGASVKAGKLKLSATNKAETNLTVIGVSKDTTVNAAAVVNQAEVHSTASIAAGASIDVSNEVHILAHNENRFSSSATSMALGSGQVGVAVNYSKLNTGATASNSANLINTSLSKLTIEALNDTVTNKSAAGTSAGSSAIAAAIIEPLLGLPESGMNKLLGKVESGPQKLDDTAGGDKPKIGAAVTYADNIHNATAFIGDNAQVTTTQDVVVAAKVNDQRIRTHATASVEGKKDDPHNPGVSLGLAGAVTVGLYEHNAKAYIGDHAKVAAQHVGVVSDLSIPYEVTWAKWEGVGTIIGKLNSNLGIGDGLLSGWSNATVGGCVGACLAGSVTYIDFDNFSYAHLGRGAEVKIVQGGADSWSSSLTGDSSAFVGTNNTTIPDVRTQNWTNPLHVLAKSDVQGVYVAGNMSLLLNGAGGEPGATAIGGGYNQVSFDTATRAWVSEGALVEQSAGEAVNLTVQADAKTQITAVTPSAGRGASYGGNIIFSMVKVNDHTEASIDDEAKVTGASVNVKAENNEIAWSLSGAFNKSDSAGVGAGVAINDVTTDTQAKIADNDANNVGGSSLSASDGKVKASSLAVTARTDGAIESIAVAGAAATSSAPEGRPRSNAVEAKASSSFKDVLGKIPLLGKYLGNPSGDGGLASAQNPPKFGLAVSGSAAVNLVNLGTHAYLDGANIEHPATGSTRLDVSAVNDTDIKAATGSGALARANNPSSTWSAGVAGSVSVNLVENKTEAYLKDSKVINAQDASVTALAGGEQLAVAIGVALNLSADQKKSASVAGSVSISEAENRVSARLENSTLTGQAAGSGREVNVIAYERLKLGTGGGSLVAGGRGGVGAAVTYSEISNTTEAIVSGTTVTNYEDITVHALTASKIGAGGAMAGGTWADDGLTFGGAFVMSDIGNTVNAEIRNNSPVTVANKVDVLAADTSGIASLNAEIDKKDGGQPNSSSLDYDGTSIGQSASAGSAITAVAGVVQVGKSNVGASFVYNKLHNTFTAAIRDSDVSAGIAGQVGVVAESNAKMLGIGFGVGVATDKFAGSGSLALSEIDNTVAAEITGTAANTITANNLTVKAEDKSRTESFAGNISASFGSGAVGASVSVNNTDNTARAKIESVDINAQQSTTVTATNNSRISAMAATAGGSKKFAFNGAAAASEISNTTDAFLLNARSDDKLDSVSVNARDTSQIDTLSGGAAFAGSGGGGAAIAVNQIDNATNAYLAGGTYTIKDLLVSSASSNLIRSLAVGIGAGKDLGVGGSVSVNLVDNQTSAYINGSASVVAENNVGVTVESDDRVTVAAGSLGIGLGGAGIGVSFTVNSITGDTSAYIDGAGTSVTGLAKNAAEKLSVNSGELAPDVKLAEKLDLATNNGLDLKSKKVKEDASGVAVNASSTEHVENISANIAGGSGLALGLVEAINVIGGSTQAYVNNARVNDQNAGAGAGQNVAIKASNIAYANSFIGGVSASGGGAGGAGEDLHAISRTTRAYAAGGSIDAIGNVGVKALAKQGVSSIAVGGAVGGLAGAGTLSMVLFNNLTDAYVDGTRVSASSLAITADNSNNMYVLSGAVAIGGSAAGGAFAVATSDSTTTATLKNANGANRVDVSGDLSVEAVNKTDIHHIVVSGAGGGGTGIAGMADVNLITDRTLAGIENSEVGAPNDKVGPAHVKATHTLDIDSKAGALGVGISGGGVGAGASVNIVKAKTTASVKNSAIYSNGLTEVKASSVKHVDATALTAGVGGTLGIGGAAVVVLVGDDVKDASAAELNKGGTGTLNSVNKFTTGDRFADLPAAFGPGILATDERSALNAATNKSTTGVTGSAGGFEFRTAAEVNGVNTITAGSFDVTATDKTDTKTLVGGLGISLGGGVGGAVAVTSVKANVAANVSGTSLTTTGNVNVKATADKDVGKTIDVLAIAGGAGIVGVGAAVAVTDITNNVDANLASGANAGSGTVTVTAEDRMEIDADAKGAAVGAAAAGVVVSHAGKNSTINASAGGEITAANATISATDQGQVKALGQAAAGGLLGAGSGAFVTASDESKVNALAAERTIFKLGSGTLKLEATGTPQTEAEADGVAVSGGLSIGASIAEARSKTTIVAKLGTGADVTSGQLDVLAMRNVVGTTPSALAKAFGASGGLLLGANATVATAASEGETNALVGDNSTLSVTGTATVKAEGKSRQSSSGLGFSGGIVAVGADFSHANSDVLTQAVLGNGVKVTGNALHVIAASEDANFAYGVAGSGGLASAPFSEATTSSISQTYARTGSGNNATSDARKIDVSSLQVTASHVVRFDSWMDNTNASLIGASGAQATNKVNAESEASIGTSGWIEADNIAMQAYNDVLKGAPPGTRVYTFALPNWDSVATPAWNINSSSGGLADIPAAGSSSTINTSALVQVGAGAHLEQTGNAAVPGVFLLDAWNSITAADKVKMSSGGAVSAASGRSEIVVADCTDVNGVHCARIEPITATVRVGDFAKLTSLGDIAMGAYTNADVSTQTAVDVYGLVGVAPAGDSVSLIRAANTIDIAAAKLESQNNIRFAAGANAAGTASNDLRASARSDVYNNTVIPANRDPVADADIGTHSQVNIASGADVGAARNVALYAEEGLASASGVGIGKDIYREALAAIASAISKLFGGGEVSFETRTGRSIRSQTSGVLVNGDVHTGINKDQSVTLNPKYDSLTSTWTLDTSKTPGVGEPKIAFQVGIAADINKRIAYLRERADRYAGTVAAAAYLAEIAFLENKLVDLGLATRDANDHIVLGTGGGNGISPQAAAINLKTALQKQYLLVVNTDLPPVKTNWDSANSTLQTANTNLGYYDERLAALVDWETEAAKSSPDATVIASKKTAVFTAENSIAAAGALVAGYARQCPTVDTCVANPSTVTASNQRDLFDTSVQDPAQSAFTTINTQKIALETQRDNLAKAVADLTAQIPNLDTAAYDGPTADFVTIPNITAKLGSILVKGDSLTGSGKLRAPGNATVTITNNTPDFLVVKDITIDSETARLTFNGVDVNNVADINRINQPGATAAFTEIVTGAANPKLPEVAIESNYNPDGSNSPSWLKGPAPDIRLTGNIINARGPVRVHSAAGSILSQGNIFAGTVDVKANNGDFVQSYKDNTDNFFHVGGDPRTIYETKNAATPVSPGGILANGSVFIGARYLNINGVVQSGIGSFELTLPSSGPILTGSASTLGVDQDLLTNYRILYQKGNASAKKTYINDAGVSITYDAEKNRLEMTEAAALADAATQKGKERNPSGLYELVADYGNIVSSYDTANDRYVVDGTVVRGGYIQLYGQIMNTASSTAGTGTGELRVLDGYGQISITNPSGKDIVLARLDTGRGVAGVIDITDVQYIDASNTPHSIKSTITRENGNVKIKQTGKWTLNASGLPQSFDDNWSDTSTSNSVLGATGLSGLASSRSATYQPQPGLAFSYAIGTDESTVTYYSYSGHTFFGLFNITQNLDNFAKVGPVQLSSQELPDGRLLVRNRPLSNDYFTTAVESVKTGTPVTTVTTDYSSCDWWFCLTQTYHLAFNIQTPTKVVTNKYLKADSPIAIRFIGADTGSVTVDSAQNVILTGQINNPSGDTSIVAGNSGTGVSAPGRNIVQGNDSAVVVSKGINLAASGSVGLPAGTGSAGAIRIAASGKVDATSTAGDVRVAQVVGDLKVGTIGGANAANVYLEADRNLVNFDDQLSSVQGRRVELLSRNGAIGELSDSVNKPLIVKTGYNADQAQWSNKGLMASARENINIRNVADPGNASMYSGNLLLISAESLAGDVRIETTGKVIDNNQFATTDTRTQTELAQLWDDLRLRGNKAVEKADEAVAAYENGKSNNYQLYWQMRKRQPDQGTVYNPDFKYTLSPAERDALAASGMNATQITQFADNRTAQYHQLHAEVGGFSTSYVPTFHYDASIATGTGEEAKIRKGSSWTDAQLALSVGSGLLKNITDTVTTIKQPNAKAENGNITLIAGTDIGSYNDPLVIDLQAHLNLVREGAPALTPQQEARLSAEKAAMAAAERGDASPDDLDNPTIITIVQPRPVNVTSGTGALNATASTGYALIGSEQDLRIEHITAASEIRIKTAESLINAASSASAVNVVGGNIILEAANGGIGSLPDSNGVVSTPLRISPSSGSGVIARAANDIWIETPQNLAVDTMFSRNNIRLDAAGSILDFHIGESSIDPDNNLRSRNLSLKAQTGSIGTSLNPLDTGVNPDGLISASAGTSGQGVYLNGPSGESFNIGSVTSGDAVSLSSATRMKIDGAVTGPGAISLVSGGQMTMTEKADIHATTLGVFLRAGSLTMEDDGVNAARMRVDVGTIDIETVGDALITGIETGNGTESAIRVVSKAGRILDNGDTRLDIIADTKPAAKLTLFGALGIGDNPLDVRLLNLLATSGGVVDIAVQNGVNLLGITAGDRVLLTAGGDITGNSVTSTGTGGTHPDQSVSITSLNGKVNLASVSGRTDVSVIGQTGVDIGTVNVGSDLQLAGPSVSARVNGGPNPITGSVTGFGGAPANSVNLILSGPGGFDFDNFIARTARVNIPLGTFSIDNAIILDRATFTNPQTLVLVDQHDKSIQRADIQLYTGGDSFSLYLKDNSLNTNSFVINRSALHEVITANGTNTSVVEQGQSELALAERSRSTPWDDEQGKLTGQLISYEGVPVSFECPSDNDPDCLQ